MKIAFLPKQKQTNKIYRFNATSSKIPRTFSQTQKVNITILRETQKTWITKAIKKNDTDGGIT